MFWRKKISLKIILGIMIPLIAIFLVTANLILLEIRRATDTVLTEELAAKSTAVSVQIGEYFTRHLEIVRQMGDNEQMVRLLRQSTSTRSAAEFSGIDEVRQTLSNIKQGETNMFQVWMVVLRSREGIFPGEAVQGLPEYDITRRPWYEALVEQDEMFVTEPYFDRTGKTAIFSMMLPIFEGGEKVGCVAVDLSMAEVYKIIENYSIGETGFLLMFDGDGTLIFHPDETQILAKAANLNLSAEILQAIGGREAGSYVFTVDGVTCHGSLSVIGDNGWMVLTCLPEAEFFGSYNYIRTAIILIFLIGGLALLVLAVAITAGIVRPIRQLADVANEIADGNLDVQVNVKAMDETALVATALSRTTVRLREYIAYINEVVRVLDQVGRGDLSFQLTLDYVGEFRRVKQALLDIQVTMATTLTNIRVAAQQVESGSTQIAEGAQLLARGANEQSSSITELERNVEDISRRIESSAHHARQASHGAEKVVQEVENSNECMREMAISMGNIEQCANQIRYIGKAIEDIAFQTNMLALNAAVEAARAGTAGKGFAVVADEVRNLATKSTNSANEIVDLVESSVKTVEQGVAVSVRMEQSLAQVVEQARRVAQRMHKINSQTSVQDELIHSIVQSMDQISTVVQTNAGMAEEKASSSEELAAQAKMLYDMLAKFEFLSAGDRQSLSAPPENHFSL